MFVIRCKWLQLNNKVGNMKKNFICPLEKKKAEEERLRIIKLMSTPVKPEATMEYWKTINLA